MARAADEGRPVVLVIPCFNEAARLPTSEAARLVADPRLALVLVDDGSTDGTGQVLRRLADELPGVSVLSLPRNVGKAEAVRQGLLQALSADPLIVGFVDADFATPADEVLRLVRCIEQREGRAVLIGSRVLLSGRTVIRRPLRHVLGRVVATYLSLAYDLQIYDTQCGAKLFRVDERLRTALGDPFATRWLFDVELLLRLRDSAEGPASVREEPLETWQDVPGSRLGGREVRQVLTDFVALGKKHRRRLSR